MLWKVLIVFVGSGVGGALRFLLSGWLTARFGPFPYGTITVNVLGSFLIALILQLGAGPAALNSEVRLALTTGVLGGFTTYSTFNAESLALFQRGAVLDGVLNVTVTVAGCLVAGVLGLWLGRIVAPAPL